MRFCFAFIFFILILNCSESKELKREDVGSVYFLKLEFENHTYIYLVNRFNNAGNAFIHDPSCAKCLEIIQNAVEQKKIIKKAADKDSHHS